MKDKIKSFIISIAVTMAVLGIYVIHWPSFGMPKYIFSVVSEAVFLFMGLATLVIFKQTHVLKPTIKGMKEGFESCLPILIPELLLIIKVIFEALSEEHTMIPGFEIFMFAVQMLLVGLAEEVLFRGFLQNRLYKIFGSDTYKGVMLTAMITGAVFGAMHIVNAYQPEISFRAALIQALVNIPLGMIFSAIYHRSGKNLWFSILLHAAIDAMSFLGSGALWGESQEAAINSFGSVKLIMIPVYFALFFFLMRRSKAMSSVSNQEEGYAQQKDSNAA